MRATWLAFLLSLAATPALAGPIGSGDRASALLKDDRDRMVLLTENPAEPLADVYIRPPEGHSGLFTSHAAMMALLGLPVEELESSDPESGSGTSHFYLPITDGAGPTLVDPSNPDELFQGIDAAAMTDVESARTPLDGSQPVVTTPEPSTVVSVVMGLVTLAGLGRLRARRLA